MLPISDFSFVVAGFATFAATVGYACTRRLSANSSTSDQSRDDLYASTTTFPKEKALESQSTEDGDTVMITDKSAGLISTSTIADVADVELASSGVSSHGKENLKRKIPHDGFEEPEKPVKTELGYPHNLAQIYPASNKRRKTPPIIDGMTTTTTAVLAADSDLGSSSEGQASMIDAPQSPLNTEDLDLPLIPTTPGPEPPHTPSPVAEAPSPVPASPSPTIPFIIQPVPHHPSTPLVPPATPKLPVNFLPASPSPTIPFIIQDVLHQPSAPLVRPATPKLPASGFAAFAGSASPFSTLAHKGNNNGDDGATTLNLKRSIWSSSKSDLRFHQNEDAGNLDGDSLKQSSSRSVEGNALGETKPAANVPSTKYTHRTGEEDERVEMELKGVKLYIKRGEKPFGDGIVGHIKLLVDRTTREERILFRREPLWKVSMNVRVQPTVRCAFVPEENALKLILKESVEPLATDSKGTMAEVKQDLVIYVLKPGRICPKQDFRDFARTLVDNSHFKTSSKLP